MDMLWLLLENNSPKHFALKCVTCYVSHCSLQSDSVVIWNFFIPGIFCSCLCLDLHITKTRKTPFEKICAEIRKNILHIKYLLDSCSGARCLVK